jgi:hypothetical protein
VLPCCRPTRNDRRGVRTGVRGVVCYSRPVVLSNSNGLDGVVSCQAGQASLLNRTVGIFCDTVSLPLYLFSTTE